MLLFGWKFFRFCSFFVFTFIHFRYVSQKTLRFDGSMFNKSITLCYLLFFVLFLVVFIASVYVFTTSKMHQPKNLVVWFFLVRCLYVCVHVNANRSNPDERKKNNIKSTLHPLCRTHFIFFVQIWPDFEF